MHAFPDVGDYVAGAARAHLDDDGRFRLPAPTFETPYAMVSEDEAANLAMGVVRAVPQMAVLPVPGARGLAETVEEKHGAPIDWEAIDRGPGRVYFAESHLDPLPRKLEMPSIRHFGPWYLVPVYVADRPVAQVGIAAHATNLHVNAEGLVGRVNHEEAGSEFLISGIPRDLGGTMPPSPERAVQFAFGETGARVVDVPVLGVPGNRHSPLGARWRIRLEEQVRFERLVDGERVSASEIFVGLHSSVADRRKGGTGTEGAARLRLLVAAESQPEVERVSSSHAVPVRSGYAVNLHEVIPVR